MLAIPYGETFRDLSTAFFGSRPRSRKLRAVPATAVTAVARGMKCTRTETRDEPTLRIEGALDVHTAPEIRDIFDSVIASQPVRVTLDLEGLAAIDSSGVGAIVSLFKRLNEAGGRLVVRGVQGQPLAVCKLLKLDRVFGL